MRPPTTSDLRAELLDASLPLQFARHLWDATIRVACTPDELAQAFRDHRRIVELVAAPDGGGEPLALERVEVELPGGRRGVRIVSRASARPCTADERAAYDRGERAA